MSDCCAVKAEQRSAPSTVSCAACGSRSKRVAALTVKSLVRHLAFAAPRTQYYFCTAPGCDLVYFPLDPEAPIYRRSDLLVRVEAKEPEDSAPLCYCFGITRNAIDDEIRSTGRSTAAERITAEVKAGNCACEVKNPSGKCCLGSVTRAVQQSLQALRAAPANR
ncbi:MAG: copper chaperone Copz family protein [Acidobacteria bacterium]|nr:copper chaperone Copz family protein [Acidobacteriota bacterium]